MVDQEVRGGVDWKLVAMCRFPSINHSNAVCRVGVPHGRRSADNKGCLSRLAKDRQAHDRQNTKQRPN